MLKVIRRDKWKHFIVGVIMGVMLQGLLVWLLPPYIIIGSVIVLIIICAISYGFELTSLIIKKGQYDIVDAVASVVGGLSGMAIVLLVR